MHVIQRLTDDIFVSRNKEMQFGRTKGSITNENIAYAPMRTYGHLWGVCALTNIQFLHTKYQIFFDDDTCMVRIGYRPKCDI